MLRSAISSERRLLVERALERYHQNAFDTLSAQQKHKWVLDLVSEYDGQSDIMSLHFCSLCSKKECERHGSGTTREYQCCNSCKQEVCSECDPSLIEWIDSRSNIDFMCNKCTLACKQTE